MKLAEIFYSVQGEGVWAGTPMLFIRVAGCNVGVYKTPEDSQLRVLREQNPKLSVCTSALGHEFLCDTDYHGYIDVDLTDAAAGFGDLIEREFGWSKMPSHVCLTGGEPFLHPVPVLFYAFRKLGMETLHIETSGTLQFPGLFFGVVGRDSLWITCSPKQGFLRENQLAVSEWKILVAEDTKFEDVNRLLGGITSGPEQQPVFLQPINGVSSIHEPSVRNAMALALQSRGVWRLSLQLHKILGVR